MNDENERDERQEEGEEKKQAYVYITKAQVLASCPARFYGY